MDTDDYTLKAAEKQAILRALRRTRGNIRASAELLQCGKTTLYRKIGFYKLKREDWECISISDVAQSPVVDSNEDSILSESQEETMSNGAVPTSDELAAGVNSSSDEFPITELG